MRHLTIEASIPFAREIASQLGEVSYLESKDFSADTIVGAEALLVRSITPCTPELLKDSSVGFIATATSGYEHIDTTYCDSHGIQWTNAAGCNALAVVQYVLSCLSLLSIRGGFDLRGKTLGIVGVGNVGSRLARYAQGLGLRTLCYDPPRAEREGQEGFVSLEEILTESDIISLHVPLTQTGNHPTYHMVGRAFLGAMKRQPILINACRGRVVDTDSLIWAKRTGLCSHLVIDCWEGEPHISNELLRLSSIGTPHIAGFSADGKFNATRLALGKIAEHWGIRVEGLMDKSVLPAPNVPIIDLDQYSPEEALRRALLHTFDPTETDRQLRAGATDQNGFERLRKQYSYPREMGAYLVSSQSEELLRQAAILGFQINPS